MKVVKDFNDPLATDALRALGDLGHDEVGSLIQVGIQSRSDSIVIEGTLAAEQLLSRSLRPFPVIREQLADLVTNRRASTTVRWAALDALVALDDPRLNDPLRLSVRDAAIESTPLMTRIEELLALRSVALQIEDE